jgi:hypothetical protein
VVALEVHCWRLRSFYRRANQWVAGVKVEFKKMKKDIYDDL